MVEFSGEGDFEEWINQKPIWLLETLVLRSALRLIPLYFEGKKIKNGNNHFFLPLFRAAASSILNNVNPRGDVGYAFAATQKDSNAAAYKAHSYYVNKAANSAYSLISIEFSPDETDRFKSIFQSIRYAVKANSLFYSDIWDGISFDATQIEKGLTPVDILSSSLWCNFDEPIWSPIEWKGLTDYFTQVSNEHWHVWTDWWEDRRDGKPYNIEMEREIVLIPDEDWQKGPAHVNPMIAEIRARYAAKDIPADNKTAPAFETLGNRIAPRITLPEEAPSDDQTALYDALREQAVELQGLCPENSNRYGAQGKAVGGFLSALGADYESMRITALWLAAQKMRRFERADAAKQGANDPDDEPMEPDQSALFSEVVTTYNVFSTGEPDLRAMDEKGRDPATLSPIVTDEAKVIREVVGKVPPLFTEDTVEVLDAVLEEADDPTSGIGARGVVLTRETFENLMGALARMARAEPQSDPSEISKGAKTVIGGGIVTGGAVTASAFIAVYQAPLLAFAAKLPASAVWTAIIKGIAAGWAGHL